MRFTLHTDYALRTLMYLGLRDRESLSRIGDIANSYGISENHLVKVVQRLSREGWVETVRGRNGGIRLAVEPQTINLGDLVRRCEEDMRLVECFDPKTNTCPIAEVCVGPPVLDKALAAFLQVLDQHHLSDLLAPRQRLAAILAA